MIYFRHMCLHKTSKFTKEHPLQLQQPQPQESDLSYLVSHDELAATYMSASARHLCVAFYAESIN